MPRTPCSSSSEMHWSSVVPPGDWEQTSGAKPRRASRVSIDWAKAAKIGLVNSGTMTPTTPSALVRRLSGRS